MNRDQVEGALKDRAGKSQPTAKAAGISDRDVKGSAKSSEASLHNASDNVRVALKNSRHS